MNNMLNSNQSGLQSGLNMLRNVDVCLSVELGKTTLKLKDVMALAEDSIVALDRMTDELLDVMVNGRIIAKAEIINQEGRFALRIARMGDDDNCDDHPDNAGIDKGALGTNGLDIPSAADLPMGGPAMPAGQDAV